VPALDGIRGVAILLVVLSHAFNGFGNGVLGVDLFFVLSGFLITTLLLEEHQQTGAISLRAFYERRCRRLLPALFVLLASYAILETLAGRDSTLEVVYGAFYLTNLFPLPLNGLSHLWSLAEEEQFYIVWPLLLIWILRRRSWLAIPGLLCWALIVAAHRYWLPHYAVIGTSFYSPDTRSDALAIGCLFAVLRNRDELRVTRICRLMSPAAWTVIVLTVLAVSTGTPFARGVLLPVLFLMFAVVVVSASRATTRRSTLLTTPPMLFLGRISYSLYLWHLPILTALGTGVIAGRFDGRMSIVAIVLAVAVATLSTYYIERPFRRRSNRSITHPVATPLARGGEAQAATLAASAH
jgi:peptidoglycan/LPS O-acetylase OafA/YrhL